MHPSHKVLGKNLWEISFLILAYLKKSSLALIVDGVLFCSSQTVENYFPPEVLKTLLKGILVAINVAEEKSDTL